MMTLIFVISVQIILLHFVHAISGHAYKINTSTVHSNRQIKRKWTKSVFCFIRNIDGAALGCDVLVRWKIVNQLPTSGLSTADVAVYLELLRIWKNEATRYTCMHVGDTRTMTMSSLSVRIFGMKSRFLLEQQNIVPHTLKMALENFVCSL